MVIFVECDSTLNNLHGLFGRVVDGIDSGSILWTCGCSWIVAVQWLDCWSNNADIVMSALFDSNNLTIEDSVSYHT
jgi:hypothetical protein